MDQKDIDNDNMEKEIRKMEKRLFKSIFNQLKKDKVNAPPPGFFKKLERDFSDYCKVRVGLYEIRKGDLKDDDVFAFLPPKNLWVMITKKIFRSSEVRDYSTMLIEIDKKGVKWS